MGAAVARRTLRRRARCRSRHVPLAVALGVQGIPVPAARSAAVTPRSRWRRSADGQDERVAVVVSLVGGHRPDPPVADPGRRPAVRPACASASVPQVVSGGAGDRLEARRDARRAAAEGAGCGRDTCPRQSASGMEPGAEAPRMGGPRGSHNSALGSGRSLRPGPAGGRLDAAARGAARAFAAPRTAWRDRRIRSIPSDMIEIEGDDGQRGVAA